MEVAEVRRRLRAAIERARRQAAARRERMDQASRDYDRFLVERAVPVFNTLAAALAAEGYRFIVHTPASSVRLASERSSTDFLELALEMSSDDQPVLVLRTNRGRGSRQVTTERVVRHGLELAGLTDEDVLGFVLEDIEPFVER